MLRILKSIAFSSCNVAVDLMVMFILPPEAHAVAYEDAVSLHERTQMEDSVYGDG